MQECIYPVVENRRCHMAFAFFAVSAFCFYEKPVLKRKKKRSNGEISWWWSRAYLFIIWLCLIWSNSNRRSIPFPIQICWPVFVSHTLLASFNITEFGATVESKSFYRVGGLCSHHKLSRCQHHLQLVPTRNPRPKHSCIAITPQHSVNSIVVGRNSMLNSNVKNWTCLFVKQNLNLKTTKQIDNLNGHMNSQRDQRYTLETNLYHRFAINHPQGCCVMFLVFLVSRFFCPCCTYCVHNVFAPTSHFKYIAQIQICLEDMKKSYCVAGAYASPNRYSYISYIASRQNSCLVPMSVYLTPNSSSHTECRIWDLCWWL